MTGAYSILIIVLLEANTIFLFYTSNNLSVDLIHFKQARTDFFSVEEFSRRKTAVVLKSKKHFR